MDRLFNAVEAYIDLGCVDVLTFAWLSKSPVYLFPPNIVANVLSRGPLGRPQSPAQLVDPP